ncbi:MAG: ATP-binding cassette domain-containing protein [Magnetococcales bacterium]|nr:ATP-binding cassette domain-containing protein [Magnetococcales bacterium]
MIQFRNVSISFGGHPLLDGADLVIEKRERICLVGRNGAGKTTLMKLLAGDLKPDGGEIQMPGTPIIARLEQEVPQDTTGTVFEVAASDQSGLEELAGADDEWQRKQRVEKALSQLQLDPEARFGDLSGGLKRRVLLARALARNPDLLLLDEPTNHMDIASIDWMEKFLLGYSGALLFISHDRMFLERLATRIIDLENGRLTSWPGDFETYQRRKQEMMETEAQHQAAFDRKLSQEETWIRQGIKARRTRNEGRVRALVKMRREREQRRARVGSAKGAVQQAERSGKLVIETKGITYAYDTVPYVKNFSTLILRGDRIGILGPNGCGKSTLLHLLLGKLEPLQGTVRHGARLEPVFFDQLRAQLDDTQSVADSVAGGREFVTVDGKPRHIISHLQDFLFTPERARTPVKVLSGGERNRLLLARIFLKPSNVMILDEPTNDLDMETMELLEEQLQTYTGTLLLVSHDRAFLNNVVTSVFAFEGDGRIAEYVGGYDDWLRQRPQPLEPPPVEAKNPRPKQPARNRNRAPKLSYKEQKALESLPGRIERLEEEQQSLFDEMGLPAFYQNGESDRTREVETRAKAVEAELETAYEAWERLEARKEELEAAGG